MLQRTVVLCVCGILFSVAGIAQERPRGEVRGGRTDAEPNRELDSALATKLLLGNQEEVAISKLAVDRAQDQRVKKFAGEMIEAHMKAIEELKGFARDEAAWKLDNFNAVVPRSAEGRRDEVREPAARNPRRAADGDNPRTERVGQDKDREQDAAAAQRDRSDQPRTVPRDTAVTAVEARPDRGTRPSRALAIEREAAQKCLELTIAELEQHQGENFDKAYIGQQIVGHIGMIAKLETYQQHASPELREIVAKSLVTAQKHLQEAKEICNEQKAENLENRKTN